MSAPQQRPNPTHRLDVLGFHCPVPVAKAREALERLTTGCILEVLADDPETLHDIPLFLGRGPHLLLNVHQEDGEYRFLIEVSA
jgi:tRNA 2-thiouridine synthesizing protein A